jgi:hypothetical protein
MTTSISIEAKDRPQVFYLNSGVTADGFARPVIRDLVAPVTGPAMSAMPR